MEAFLGMGWDGTKSLWDGSSRSHAKPGPGPGWDKALVGWELPSRSHGQPICYQELLSQFLIFVLLVCEYCSHTAYNVLHKIIQFVLDILFVLPAFNNLICMHSFENMNLKQQ